MDRLEQIKHLELQLKAAREAYLRESGWTYECPKPWNRWAWRAPHTQMLVYGLETAVEIQREQDELRLEEAKREREPDSWGPSA